jgi:4'-phosphopantetheinyl transferase
MLDRGERACLIRRPGAELELWRCAILSHMRCLTLPWRPAPETLTLNNDEVHVWRAPLDVPELSVRSLWYLLAGDECQRAERYVFEKDRKHFVVARGLLRVLLGRYLGQDPQHLRFTYGPHGKPALATDTGGDTLRFNVSHSYGLALYGVTRGREIGVDVEHIRPEVAQETIAEHFFSPREVTILRALPISLQALAFFACWTRKEAYIKATGDGLALPLDQFDVSLAPGEPAALLRTAWDPQEAARWAMHDLAPAPDYRAAVAVAGHDWHLACWDEPAAYLNTPGAPRGA